MDERDGKRKKKKVKKINYLNENKFWNIKKEVVSMFERFRIQFLGRYLGEEGRRGGRAGTQKEELTGTKSCRSREAFP